MSRPLIGRTVRRIRIEQSLTQQVLAARLGISASYLNLIEHDQRNVTASLLIKLAEVLHIDLASLSGSSERQLEAGLREVFADPLLAAEQVPDGEVEALAAGNPNAARAVLALYRAWRVAREDASGIALPSGRRLLLPTEETRELFNDRGNHFPTLEAAAELVAADMGATPAETNHAIAERLRRHHGLVVNVGPLEGALRRYDPASRSLMLSEQLPRESRGFHMAFQLMMLEAHDAVEGVLDSAAATTVEAAQLIRIGLLNYAAGALLMPYAAFATAARQMRHDLESLARHFGVSFEQACHRVSTLQRPTQRGIPFFFLRIDPAGNVSKRFSGAGFPFASFGGSCPRWIVHGAYATPGILQVQLAQLPDGATFLCVAKTIMGVPAFWGDPAPVHVIAMGCDAAHADEIVYADRLDRLSAVVGIGLSCRLCARPNCRSRAFPPLEHRLALDPHTASDSPYRFAVPAGHTPS